MPKFFPAQTAVFFLSSLVTIALVYFKVDISWLQKIVAVILFILLLLLNKFLNPGNNQKISGRVSIISLFLATVFVQLIVISTGGLKSPFLALIHIFTLAISFLISLQAALIFLGLSLLTIFANFWLDKNIQSFFQDDPGTVLLYLVSFVVIVPLSILVTRYYYLKDAVAKVLGKEVRAKELEQEMMLQGLNELVVVTDKDLTVVSANESAEKMLSSTGSVILKRPIFDVLILKDDSEKMMDKISLSVQETIEQRQGRQFDNLYLYARNIGKPRKVVLKVKPIVNLEGVVDQVSFVISDTGKSFTDTNINHLNLETARTKERAAIEALKEKLISGEQIQRLEIIKRMNEDLLYGAEVEDHTIGEQHQPADIAELCKRAVISEDSFAKSLNVNLKFSLLNFNSNDTEKIVPRGINIEPINLTAPFFTAPVEVKWFNILISKLLDLSIMLTSGTEDPGVSLSIDREGNKTIVINILINHPGFSEEETKLLLTEYYGPLSNTTNLRFGSGLEGSIIKKVALALNIPLVIAGQKGVPGINITLKVDKDADKNLNGTM